jgi:protocatechuate 4,5-dioxygenase alpha chain
MNRNKPPDFDNPTVNRVLDRGADVMEAPNSMVLDGERSRLGYRINRFCFSLKSPQNRAAFKADMDGYMKAQGLTDAERALVLNQDWLGLVASGASIYTLVKLTGSMGSNLLLAGLKMRGEDMAAFRASRAEQGVAANPHKGSR